MKSIDLGRKMDTLAEPISPKKTEKVYPTLWIDEAEGELELPDSGTMTISFVMKEKTERETENGKTCSYRLEVRSIDDLKEDESSEPEENTERNMDKAVASYKKTYVKGE
jgi:hypothetical protein